MDFTYGICVYYVILCKSGISDGWSSRSEIQSGADSQVFSKGDHGLSTGESEESMEGSLTAAGDSAFTSHEHQTKTDDEQDANAAIHKGLGKNKKEARSSFKWRLGTVPFHIDEQSYDEIIARRIRMAMKTIESASCVVFKNIAEIPPAVNVGNSWLHITNPHNERDCVHGIRTGKYGEAVLTLGFECMQKRDIIHALLHILGFKDEVTHPQRDSFVRVLWENIQPKYHSLFSIRNDPNPYQTLVEYDTMSIMHFHDRAFTSNGGATITPLAWRRPWNKMKIRNRKAPAPLKSVPKISGLLINPSDGLSQLDKMKLRLAFGHECNKRKVDKLFETCKNSLFSDEYDKGPLSETGSDTSRTGDEDEEDKDQNNDFKDETRLKDLNNDGKAKEDSENGSDNANGDGSIPARPNNGLEDSKDIDVKMLGSKFGDKLGWEKKRG